MRKTTHEAAIPSESFTETTEGDAPSSVEVTVNAKGEAQFSIKFYYESPSDATDNVNANLVIAVREVRDALATLHIPLAGSSNNTSATAVAAKVSGKAKATA